MSDINKWRLSCTECGDYVYWLLEDGASTPDTCPENSSHTVSGAVIVGIHKDQGSFAANGSQYTKPTTIKNEHTLKPFGLVKVHFDSADQARSITLTNKSDQTFDYTVTGDEPEAGDLIFQADGTKRAYVASVDDQSSPKTLTIGTESWDYELSNSDSDTVISKPVPIDYIMPGTPGSGYLYFWGLVFDCNNYHDNDVMFIVIDDPYNMMGQGAGYEVARYEQSWVQGMAACEKCLPPDGSPAELVIGLRVRLMYYPYDTSTRVIDAYTNHLITDLDG